MRRLAFIAAAKRLGLGLEETEQRRAELAVFTSWLRTALEHVDALP